MLTSAATSPRWRASSVRKVLIMSSAANSRRLRVTTLRKLPVVAPIAGPVHDRAERALLLLGGEGGALHQPAQVLALIEQALKLAEVASRPRRAGSARAQARKARKRSVPPPPPSLDCPLPRQMLSPAAANAPQGQSASALRPCPALRKIVHTKGGRERTKPGAPLEVRRFSNMHRAGLQRGDWSRNAAFSGRRRGGRAART